MGRKAKVANNPIAKNLNKLLRSGLGIKKNLELIEKETGIPGSTIRNWVGGFRKAQQANLEKVAKYFNVDVYSLYDDPDKEPSPEHKQIMSLIPQVKDENILEALKSLARAGVIQNRNNKNVTNDKK